MTERSRTLARLSLLAALTFAGQAAGLPQPVTGPFVNAMLLLTLAFVGWGPAVGVGFVTPAVALLRGVLPPALGPVVPVIAVGNALLVSVYTAVCRLWGCRPTSPGWLAGLAAVGTAALGKFLWLSLCVQLLLPVAVGLRLPAAATFALTTVQLSTALAGGIGALLISAALRRTGLFSALRQGKRTRSPQP